MKIPFYTVLGPLLKRNHRVIKYFCSHPAMSLAPIYVAILGSIGVILSIFDMMRIINCGPILPAYLWKTRINTCKIISPSTERDFKLICLVWSCEYYFLLIVGLLTNNPIFFLPFLMLYAGIVSLEFVIFILRIFTEGLCFSKTSLIMSMFMIFNWLSVFCTFAHSTTGCDL